MTIKYKYDSKKNPRGLALVYVPLRDLTEKDLEGKPDWVIKSIEQAPYFSKAKPPTPNVKIDVSVPAAAPKEEKAKVDPAQAKGKGK